MDKVFRSKCSCRFTNIWVRVRCVCRIGVRACKNIYYSYTQMTYKKIKKSGTLRPTKGVPSCDECCNAGRPPDVRVLAAGHGDQGRHDAQRLRGRRQRRRPVELRRQVPVVCQGQLLFRRTYRSARQGRSVLAKFARLRQAARRGEASSKIGHGAPIHRLV